MNKTRIYLKNDKKRILIIIAAFIVGGIFLAISSFTSDESAVKKTSDVPYSYEAFLEQRLTQILEKAVGVGNIDVMITLEESYEISDGSTSVFLHNDSKEEVKTIPYPKVKGAVIVCRNISQKTNFDILKKAAATALGTDKNKIYIFGGELQQ